MTVAKIATGELEEDLPKNREGEGGGHDTGGPLGEMKRIGFRIVEPPTTS